MNKAQIEKKIAKIEEENIRLLNEVADLDRLMRVIGFSGGLAAMKATAMEIVRQNLDNSTEI